jgi:hypothetical protein
MSEAETYDTHVQTIRAYNRLLLERFGTWLEHKGWTSPTIITHLGNIYLFASYLVYAEPLKKLDEASNGDVWMFLGDCFPKPRVVGFGTQRPILLYLVEEALPVDGRNTTRFPRNRCRCD